MNRTTTTRLGYLCVAKRHKLVPGAHFEHSGRNTSLHQNTTTCFVQCFHRTQGVIVSRSCLVTRTTAYAQRPMRGTAISEHTKCTAYVLTWRPKACPNAFTDSVLPVPAGPYGFPPKPICMPCIITRTSVSHDFAFRAYLVATSPSLKGHSLDR